MLSNFKWYRRARGGRWATVSGMIWGRQWIHLPETCGDRAEEDWQNVAIPVCRHGIPMDQRCRDCMPIRHEPPGKSRYA